MLYQSARQRGDIKSLVWRYVKFKLEDSRDLKRGCYTIAPGIEPMKSRWISHVGRYWIEMS
jgi:hypothetical protein